MRTHYLNLKMDYLPLADGDPVNICEQAVSTKPIFGYDLAFKIDIDKVSASFKAPAPNSTKWPGKSHTAENYSELARTAKDMAVNNAFGTEESYREELGKKVLRIMLTRLCSQPVSTCCGQRGETRYLCSLLTPWILTACLTGQTARYPSCLPNSLKRATLIWNIVGATFACPVAC